jgi:hypothetical protein
MQTLYSKILSVVDIDNSIIEFNRVSLQVCERIPADTDIKYYIAALNDPMSLSSVWVPIDHMDKKQPLHPKEIVFGHLLNLTLPGSKISYMPLEINPIDVNPGKDYTIWDVVNDAFVAQPVSTSAIKRYAFLNSNDRILDYQIKSTVSISPGSLELFRNVGIRNTDSSDSTMEVRNIRAGWGFKDPYYSSAIEVDNAQGVVINFGDKALIVDGTVVKGKVTLTQGLHLIQVHKNNWINIPGALDPIPANMTIDLLKANDPLFPFNHKHLIEGYGFNDPNNPYTGIDIFAEIYMKQVSIADIIHNVSKDDYTRFATDFDAGNPNPPSLVFVVKSDENKSDMLDELFTIRFDLKKQLYKYLKFKAEFSSESADVSPNLDGYKLKISRGSV